MFKIVWVTRFRKGMTMEEASTYWADVHGPIGATLPGLTGYVQNTVVGTIGASSTIETERAFDGYACEEFRDLATFEATMKTPEWDAVAADGPLIFDVDSMSGMSAVVEQRVMRDGPFSPFKVAWFARFRPDLSREEASDYWLNVHGPLALEVTGIDRYVQNFVVGSVGGDGPGNDPVRYDGFSECWFASREAYDRSMVTPEWARLVEDGPNLLDMEALEQGMSVVVRELILLPEPKER